MKSGLRKVEKRKWFWSRQWTFTELKQLNNILKIFDIRPSRALILINFKENRVKFWLSRYRRLDKIPNISSKYTAFLRYGKTEGCIRWDNTKQKISFCSSREGFIAKFGEDKANKIIYKRGANFRNPDVQKTNSLKFKNKKIKNPELYNGYLQTQLQYWINAGYNIDEAIIILKERQTTFSLEKCVAKYGLIDGTIKWQNRQDNWQSTLLSKSLDEVNEINIRKNPILKRDNETKEMFFRRLSKLGTKLIYDADDLRNYIKESLKDVKWEYLTKEEFIKSLPYCGNSQITPDDILAELCINFPEENLIRKNGKHYVLNVPEGYLRSSLEIHFYFELKKRNISFELEKFYDENNKNFKSDYYIIDHNIFIEIAGKMNEEVYKNKMAFKEYIYDALVITPKMFKLFFRRIDTHGFDGIKDYVRGII